MQVKRQKESPNLLPFYFELFTSPEEPCHSDKEIPF